MTPEALAKLWRRHSSVPYCDAAQLQSIENVSSRLRESPNPAGVQFWGVIEERFRTQNHSMLHCFNFGNITVKYPWDAEAVNFGNRFPLTITGSGTVRLKKTHRSLLHSMETPFLSFPFTNAPMLVEQLQPGYLICALGSGQMRSTVTVVFPDGMAVPTANGILYYFLMKRVPFTVQPSESVVLPGDAASTPACVITLAEPMILERGWPVLVLEGNRYSWGVVSS